MSSVAGQPGQPRHFRVVVVVGCSVTLLDRLARLQIDGAVFAHAVRTHAEPAKLPTGPRS
jgi:hypothetical protein